MTRFWSGMTPVVSAALMVSGCATLSSVKSAQGRGVAREYSHSLQQIFPLARRAVAQAGLNLVEAQYAPGASQGMIVATKGLSLTSYGERVAVFVTAVDSDTTKVEIVSKKVLATNVFAKNWTEDIFAALDALLRTSGSETPQ